MTLEHLQARRAAIMTPNPETQKTVLNSRALSIAGNDRLTLDDRYHRLTAIVELAEDLGLQSVELFKLHSRLRDKRGNQ